MTVWTELGYGVSESIANSPFVAKDALVINVKDHLAKGDGVTDDAAAIQAAINLAHAVGGGVVFFPVGTYIIGTTLILYDYVTLKGIGPQGTVLKLKNSANTTVIRTENFATLTGTDPTSNYGPTLFGLVDLTIDGNKSNNTSGWCAQFYGSSFLIDNVVFRYGKSGNLYTEFTTGAGVDPTASIEAQLVNVKSHDTDGVGIHSLGPHDSQWLNVVVWRAGLASGAGTAVLLDIGADGTQITQLHTWGWSLDYGVRIKCSGVQLSNCEAEGAEIGQYLIEGDQNSIEGGFQYASGGGKGIILGSVGLPATNTRINTRLKDFTYAVDFANDGGGTEVIAYVSGSGSTYTGTINSWSRAEFHVSGQGVLTVEGDTNDWDNYTPVLTSSGTQPTLGTTGSQQFGRYKVCANKVVHISGRIVFGTGMTPGTGQYYISLPVPRKSLGGFGGGQVLLVDNSASDWRPGVLMEGDTDNRVRFVASGATSGAAGATSPWTWAVSDEIRFTYTYEGA